MKYSFIHNKIFPKYLPSLSSIYDRLSTSLIIRTRKNYFECICQIISVLYFFCMIHINVQMKKKSQKEGEISIGLAGRETIKTLFAFCTTSISGNDDKYAKEKWQQKKLHLCKMINRCNQDIHPVLKCLSEVKYSFIHHRSNNSQCQVNFFCVKNCLSDEE